MCSIKEYLVKILKNKLNYLRFKAHGTIRPRNDCLPPIRKKRLTTFSPKPLVLLPMSDDCGNGPSEHERDLMVLQEEEGKMNPNNEVVMDLMRKTYSSRRQNILSVPTSLTDLLKIYPSLKDYYQVGAINYMYKSL